MTNIIRNGGWILLIKLLRPQSDRAYENYAGYPLEVRSVHHFFHSFKNRIILSLVKLATSLVEKRLAHPQNPKPLTVSHPLPRNLWHNTDKSLEN
jgi:hypothetical protein